MRCIQDGDTYKGKRIRKWMINKKIPIFWRNYIPFLERKSGDIEPLLYDIKKRW